MFKKTVALPLFAALAYGAICLAIAFGGKPVGQESPSAALAAGPTPPLVKTFGPDRSQAEARAGRRAQFSTYRGTRIRPNPSAAGPSLRLQQEISDRFERQDPLPGPRSHYFSWLDEEPYHIRGWYGSIRDVSKNAEGWIVTISASPHLVSETAAAVFTPDYYLERYEYEQGRLRFLGGEAPAGILRAVMTD